MFSENFFKVLEHEGVVSIVTWAEGKAHVSNTWNSYLVIKDNKILIPAAGMIETQKNIEVNNNVKLTLGSKEVQGHIGMGIGFLIEGTAQFLDSGSEFNAMKEKFSFLSRVLEITVTKAEQTL